MMKCSRCRNEKQEHEYDLRKDGKRFKQCRPCRAIRRLAIQRRDILAMRTLTCTRCGHVKNKGDREYTEGLCADCYLSDYKDDRVSAEFYDLKSSMHDSESW